MLDKSIISAYDIGMDTAQRMAQARAAYQAMTPGDRAERKRIKAEQVEQRRIKAERRSVLRAGRERKRVERQARQTRKLAAQEGLPAAPASESTYIGLKDYHALFFCTQCRRILRDDLQAGPEFCIDCAASPELGVSRLSFDVLEGPVGKVVYSNNNPARSTDWHSSDGYAFIGMFLRLESAHFAMAAAHEIGHVLTLHLFSLLRTKLDTNYNLDCEIAAWRCAKSFIRPDLWDEIYAFNCLLGYTENIGQLFDHVMPFIGQGDLLPLYLGNTAALYPINNEVSA